MSEESQKSTTIIPAPAPTAPSSQPITVKVVDQEGGEVIFSMKRTTPFRKMMSSYSTRMGIAPNVLRFLYDGERIQETQTPESLKMENDDVIDAILTQVGGDGFIILA